MRFSLHASENLSTRMREKQQTQAVSSRIRSHQCCLCRCADYVLLNKIDQLQDGRLGELNDIMRSLNPLAQVLLRFCDCIA